MLAINQDNGPENNSRRTQFETHSCFCPAVANHRSPGLLPALSQQVQSRRTLLGRPGELLGGEILDEVETALHFVETMTWKGNHPHVELVPDTYRKGIRLARKEMKPVEAQVQRLPGLEKWGSSG